MPDHEDDSGINWKSWLRFALGNSFSVKDEGNGGIPNQEE